MEYEAPVNVKTEGRSRRFGFGDSVRESQDFFISLDLMFFYEYHGNCGPQTILLRELLGLWREGLRGSLEWFYASC